MGIVRKMNSFNVGWILFIVSAFTLGGNSKRYLVETKQKDTDDIPCICNKEASFPVCGVDGKTYQSQCLAKCSNVSTKCPGECPCGKKKKCPQVLLYDPVCGINGKTYDNRWIANCEKVFIHCEGECPCKKKVRSRKGKPDGKTCEKKCKTAHCDTACINGICEEVNLWDEDYCKGKTEGSSCRKLCKAPHCAPPFTKCKNNVCSN